MNTVDLDILNRIDSYEGINHYTPADLEILHHSILNPELVVRPKFEEATRLAREGEGIRRGTKIYAMRDMSFLRKIKEEMENSPEFKARPDFGLKRAEHFLIAPAAVIDTNSSESESQSQSGVE